MTIKYLAGDRLIGTTAERLALSGSTLTAVPATSWKELDRITLGSSSAEVEVTGLTAKDNLMILVYSIGSNSNDAFISFNGDEGSNYANRYSRDGGSDSTDTSQGIGLRYEQGATTPQFAVITVKNIASLEKLVIGHTVTQNSTGAGNAPNRQEWVGKWANTSNAITQVTLDRATGTFDSGTELIVLGCDDDEADSGTNFWQELGTDTLTSADQISSGTITAKKYIFGEFHATGADSTGSRPRLRFNNDTGNTYASRFNNNGGSDETPSTSYGSMYISESDMNEGCLATFFIVNVSNKEKLAIYESVRISATGAGNTPQRFEGVGKWANTSAQITEIDVIGSNVPALPFDSGTSIRVWGSD